MPPPSNRDEKAVKWQGRADNIPDLYLYYLYYLYDLAHVAGWEPYSLHDLGYVSWIVCLLYKSCTASHNGRLLGKI